MRQEKSELILCLLFFFLFPFGVSAQELEPLFTAVCREAGVSKELAMAIARQESGMDPLAINVAGQGFHPADREEAEKIIRAAQAAGKSFDVGVMQVNIQWIKKWGIAPESLLEPEAGIRAGVRVLAGEVDRHGFTWEAVGRYHSPAEERGRNYAWSVFRKAEQKPGLQSVQAKAEPQTAKTPEKIFVRRSMDHAEQTTRHQTILLYRRGGDDSRERFKGRIVRFDVLAPGGPGL